MSEHYLMGYLPTDYNASVEVVEIQDAIEGEMDDVKTAVDKLQEQMFVDTAQADWGLIRWERMYGIYPDLSMAINNRQERVLAKMRGVGTVTPAFMKALAETFVDGEVEIVEDTQNYHFQVKIMSFVGIPPLLSSMSAAIKEMKPAHLSFEIIIKYNTWADVANANYTWATAATRTWAQLRGEAL